MTARIPSKRILTFDNQAQEQSASVTVKQAFATCVLLYLCMIFNVFIQPAQPNTISAPFALEYIQKLV
jgi:hypothetical protein